ncbi:MAG: hypothetical protein IJC84_01220 [Clostridia bacterium]|nr:hypothetical protein [Clostridia bacterium]
MSVIFSVVSIFALTLLVLFTLSAVLPATGAYLLSLLGKSLGLSRRWCAATRLFGLSLGVAGLMDSIWWQQGILSDLLCALGAWALLSIPVALFRPAAKHMSSAARRLQDTPTHVRQHS